MPRSSPVFVVSGVYDPLVEEAGFWALIDRLDWTKTGDDAKVIEPVVGALAKLPGSEIQSFQDILAEKLFALDGRRWARESGPGIWWGEPASLSVDSFLYARCVVVANGRAFYKKVLSDPTGMPKDMEFETLLYIARNAEERKTGHSDGVDTRVSYETFSNAAAWK